MSSSPESAIFISIVSLIVSIHHGRTMEKLVAANEKQVEASTLPILRFTNRKHFRE
jgi:hypothetical protein